MSDDKQPKVVDQLFGDDTGFLSGLGIDIEETAVEAPVVEKEKPVEVVYEKDDIVPEMKEAKVIRKAPEKKESTKQSRKAVDDLIQKKTQTETSAYSDIGSNRRSGGPRGRTGGGRRGPQARTQFRQGRHRARKDPNKTITIGATASRTRGDAPVVEKRQKTYKVSDSLKKKGTIQMGEVITVKEFSEKMGVPLVEVMKVLLANKIVAAVHANIDYDTASLVAAEFDVTIEKESIDMDVADVLEANLQTILDQDKDADALISRPPIVTIMGHVDHGKTKLLDYLRQTDIVGGEAGGITQSIGASQITHNDQKITFIDTPGHELFTSIRARGSKLTNIVIIVIAADDGMKPQTIEAIHHAKDANVPIIVAVTKIDLGTHKLDEIKGQMGEQGLQPEEWGGDVMLIPCSSITGQGIDDLLDAILLQYEMLELKYNPERNAVAVVVEAQKDAKQGVTTTMLVMTGTLRVGDTIVVHNTFGKVRRMMDWTGKQIKTATGGDPVMILGIQDLPEPGRVAECVNSTKEAVNRISAIKEHEQGVSKEAVLQSLADKIGQGDKVQLKLIMKSDSFGSLEAAKQAAHQVEMPENVELKIVHDDVGSITSSDLVFAQASGSIIIAFNISSPGSIKKKADHLGVVIKEYDIIYEFIEYLEQVAQGMIVIEEKEVVIGKMEVLGIFFRRAKEMIFGGKVKEGKIVNGAKFRVYRPGEEELDEDGEPIPFTTGMITSLQKEQESVKEVKEGHECGMKVKVAKKVEEGDIIEFYIME